MTEQVTVVVGLESLPPSDDPATSWYDDAIGRWGEPRINIPNEQRIGGVGYRRCWVWFPKIGDRLVNHHVRIDRKPARGTVVETWHVLAGNHLGDEAQSRLKHEPTESDMQRITRAGWGL